MKWNPNFAISQKLVYDLVIQIPLHNDQTFLRLCAETIKRWNKLIINQIKFAMISTCRQFQWYSFNSFHWQLNFFITALYCCKGEVRRNLNSSLNRPNLKVWLWRFAWYSWIQSNIYSHSIMAPQKLLEFTKINLITVWAIALVLRRNERAAKGAWSPAMLLMTITCQMKLTMIQPRVKMACCSRIDVL